MNTNLRDISSDWLDIEAFFEEMKELTSKSRQLVFPLWIGNDISASVKNREYVVTVKDSNGHALLSYAVAKNAADNVVKGMIRSAVNHAYYKAY